MCIIHAKFLVNLVLFIIHAKSSYFSRFLNCRRTNGLSLLNVLETVFCFLIWKSIWCDKTLRSVFWWGSHLKIMFCVVHIWTFFFSMQSLNMFILEKQMLIFPSLELNFLFIKKVKIFFFKKNRGCHAATPNEEKGWPSEGESGCVAASIPLGGCVATPNQDRGGVAATPLLCRGWLCSNLSFFYFIF